MQTELVSHSSTNTTGKINCFICFASLLCWCLKIECNILSLLPSGVWILFFGIKFLLHSFFSLWWINSIIALIYCNINIWTKLCCSFVSCVFMWWTKAWTRKRNKLWYMIVCLFFLRHCSIHLWRIFCWRASILTHSMASNGRCFSRFSIKYPQEDNKI